MKSEVEQMTEAEICSCDFQEWVGYLAGKYAVVPITLFETNIERTLAEAKVKKASPFGDRPCERDFFEIDGVRVTCNTPFDVESNLFELQPSLCLELKNLWYLMVRAADVSRLILNIRNRRFQKKTKQCLSTTGALLDHTNAKKSRPARSALFLLLFYPGDVVIFACFGMGRLAVGIADDAEADAFVVAGEAPLGEELAAAFGVEDFFGAVDPAAA